MEPEKELKIMRKLLLSRNKLIEDLVVYIPRDSHDFEIALKMQTDSFARDRDIFEKVT